MLAAETWNPYVIPSGMYVVNEDVDPSSVDRVKLWLLVGLVLLIVTSYFVMSLPPFSVGASQEMVTGRENPPSFAADFASEADAALTATLRGTPGMPVPGIYCHE